MKWLHGHPRRAFETSTSWSEEGFCPCLIGEVGFSFGSLDYDFEVDSFLGLPPTIRPSAIAALIWLNSAADIGLGGLVDSIAFPMTCLVCFH
jgi:hypothetical protein